MTSHNTSVDTGDNGFDFVELAVAYLKCRKSYGQITKSCPVFFGTLMSNIDSSEL